MTVRILGQAGRKLNITNIIYRQNNIKLLTNRFIYYISTFVIE